MPKERKTEEPVVWMLARGCAKTDERKVVGSSLAAAPPKMFSGHSSLWNLAMMICLICLGWCIYQCIIWQIVIDGVFGIFTSINTGHGAILKNMSCSTNTVRMNSSVACILASQRHPALATWSQRCLKVGCFFPAYISLSRRLSEPSTHALVLPQILAVVPGCFFAVARSALLFLFYS